jgi:phosphohistidine phosphatase SixA
MPKRIIVIRHFNKPDSDKDQSLSELGWQRARELSDWLPRNLDRPDRIFSAMPSAHSVRPFETIWPLSQTTAVLPDQRWADDDFKSLVEHVEHHKFDDEVLLICWHHGKIPDLLDALGAPKGSYPAKWPEDDFKTYFVLDYAGAGFPAVSLEVSEEVMPF